jgi:hypothetical protein
VIGVPSGPLGEVGDLTKGRFASGGVPLDLLQGLERPPGIAERTGRPTGITQSRVLQAPLKLTEADESSEDRRSRVVQSIDGVLRWSHTTRWIGLVGRPGNVG